MSHWHDGFPQCPGCQMPLALCLCGQGKVILAKREEDINQLAELGRRLWRELFLDVDTPEQLLAWRERIPNYDCKCRDFYDHFVQENPPLVDESHSIAFEWKWSLKSAVNQKLGHADLSLEDARRFWITETQV